MYAVDSVDVIGNDTENVHGDSPIRKVYRGESGHDTNTDAPEKEKSTIGNNVDGTVEESGTEEFHLDSSSVLCEPPK
eukprot:8959776-Heterocapsa_arctica.AAC.1